MRGRGAPDVAEHGKCRIVGSDLRVFAWKMYSMELREPPQQATTRTSSVLGQRPRRRVEFRPFSLRVDEHEEGLVCRSRQCKWFDEPPREGFGRRPIPSEERGSSERMHVHGIDIKLHHDQRWFSRPYLPYSLCIWIWICSVIASLFGVVVAKVDLQSWARRTERVSCWSKFRNGNFIQFEFLYRPPRPGENEQPFLFCKARCWATSYYASVAASGSRGPGLAGTHGSCTEKPRPDPRRCHHGETGGDCRSIGSDGNHARQRQRRGHPALKTRGHPALKTRGRPALNEECGDGQ